MDLDLGKQRNAGLGLHRHELAGEHGIVEASLDDLARIGAEREDASINGATDHGHASLTRAINDFGMPRHGILPSIEGFNVPVATLVAVIRDPSLARRAVPCDPPPLSNCHAAPSGCSRA